MTVTEADTLQSWVGKQEISEDEAVAPIVRRLAALLERDATEFKAGGTLPEGWHFAFFAPLTVHSQLGHDGHPRKGDFLPPVPLPRRMFAGRRLRFLKPIKIGAALRRTSTIAGVTPKRGRSGEMVFVRVEHAISADGVPSVIEEHDIVYREEIKAGAAPTDKVGAAPAEKAPEPEAPALPTPTDSMVYAPDTVTLFRYSAVTYNGHRIHYDRPYTQNDEGYPDLVVNGGLTALMLCEIAKRNLPGGRIGRLNVRNVRPFFVNRNGLICCSRNADGTLAVWAQDEKGRPIAQGEAASDPGTAS